MLKDFSQSFTKTSPCYYLLLQDSRNMETLHVIQDDCGCSHIPSLELKKDEDLTLAIVKRLYDLGFATVRCCEVFRQFNTQYSYVDETPGRVEEIVYLQVTVDVSPSTASITNPPVPMLIYDIIEDVQSPMANAAIARLMQEIDYIL